MVFQGKRIDFRIIGILENLLFSTKHEQTVFRTKANGKLQQMCTKSLKNVKLQKKEQKRERWERGEESKNSKERGGSKRARQDLMMMMMMNGDDDGNGHGDGDGGDDDDDDDGGKGSAKGKEERMPILIHSLTPDHPPVAAISGSIPCAGVGWGWMLFCLY